MNDEALYHHFNKLVPLTTGEFAPITDAFTARTLAKKDMLLWPGEVCR